MKKVFLPFVFVLQTLLVFSQNDNELFRPQLYQIPIAVWHLDETNGLLAKESTSNTDFAIINNYPKKEAEWLAGATANALRFNGFASWIEGNLTTTMPSEQLTISAWIAPEVWPMNTAAIFTNANTSGNGCYLAMDKFGRLEISATINGVSSKKTSIEKIPIWKWSHVAMTVDATIGKIRGYLNGVQILEQNTSTGQLNWPTPNAVKIGKFHVQTLSGIYETGLFCGLIDEVKIFDNAMTTNELSNIYQNENPITVPDMSIPPSRFEGDFHRPIFHAIPAANWMNEPHGLVFYNGAYHIFYQKNGNGPYWGRLNWGHQTSTNLVTWTEQKAVLSPDPDVYDREGCWSGCSFIDNEKAYIMYTGVDGATAQMCLAEANTDASEYQKYPNNPLVQSPSAPYTANDFRDPYIWKENGNFYMIIGTGNTTGGAALLYKSTDHINWQYLYPLKKGVQANDNSGIFWEVPMFLKFGDKYVFTAQPVPNGGVPARILYWTGIFQNEVFTADTIKPKQLEPGDALLGVTTTTDAQGRTIAIGIIPDILSNTEQRKNGWANLMSLPRIWSLSADGKTLLQKPLPELEKLRGQNWHFDNLSVSDNQNGLLPNIEGRNFEIRAKIDPSSAQKIGIILAKSADNSEFTRVYLDAIAGIVIIDRNKSSINNSVPSGFLTSPVSLNGQLLDLHIFFDGSVLEVFINDEKALSTRIYPELPGSIGLDLYAQGGTGNIQTLDIWAMKNMQDNTVTTTAERPIDIKKNALEKIYPNPVNNLANLEINLPFVASNIMVSVSDISGKIVVIRNYSQNLSGKTVLELPLKEVAKGLYFIKVVADDQAIGAGTFVK